MSRRRSIAGIGALVVLLGLGLLPIRPAAATTIFGRVSGPDRYATAAMVSSKTFSPGVGVVYIATGADFPDALAAAPPAVKGGGPVLLTDASTLPAPTATELGRLKPAKIIVLGGTSSVSQAVQTSLQQYTTGTVTRIQGIDRYATATALSAATYAAGVNTVYVASGEGFADALAGGPAAGTSPSGGGPLLLTQRAVLPGATATELHRLAPQNIVVLGGTSSVSDVVLTALAAFAPNPVVRRAGADRYLTAVEVSKASFTSAPQVFLATGATFPDALAGGPAGGAVHGPVLLTQPDCIPAAVNAEITRLNPSLVVVLGGTSTVSDAVVNRDVCAAPALHATG